jgi:predicted transcriptional regulator of viral defense system
MNSEPGPKPEGLLLSPSDAAMLAWFVIDDVERLTIEEAAGKLGVSPETARVIISRAKSKLRRYAGTHWPLPAGDPTEVVGDFSTDAGPTP